jgi:DNA-binding response OmpR family regulator
MANTVLIIADDLTIRDLLTTTLSHTHLISLTASYGTEALHTLATTEIDLVIIDQTSFTPRAKNTTSEIIKRYSHIPVISLVAPDAPASILSSHDLEEQISLPIDPDGLTTMVLTLIEKKIATEILKIADLTVNSRTLDVIRDNQQIKLTPLEFKLLHYLLMNKGRIVTREMILHRIWQYSSDIETRVVDVYMGYLRKKIDKGFDKKLLHSVRSFGYVIKE